MIPPSATLDLGDQLLVDRLENHPRSVSPALRRVLHVINGEVYAGAERVQDLLAARLPEFSYSVGFACVKPGKFADCRQSREAPVFEAQATTTLMPIAIRRLSELVRRERYDLIHAHTPRSVIVGHWVARLTGVPLVYHVHSPAARDSTRPLRNWINCRAERIFAGRARRLIAVSTSLARHMASLGFDERRLSVVTNGVPSGPQPPDRSPPKDQWTLGMVALFRPRKGMEVLLEALRNLRNRGLNVHLRAVGGFQSPEYAGSLQRLAERLGVQQYVTWLGFQSDVRAQLQSMDLMVLPSLFGEGLPMVVLEAMAAGVPVVATRVEGVPEAVRDGVDGVLAEPGCPRDLATRIEQLINGQLDWTALRRSARDRQVEQFSDTSMARGVAAVYDEVLER